MHTGGLTQSLISCIKDVISGVVSSSYAWFGRFPLDVPFGLILRKGAKSLLF